jgi:hypothetical protein
MANDTQIPAQIAGQTTQQTAQSYPNEIKQETQNDLPILERARLVSEQMQKVNDETRLLLDRREKMLATEMIQGRAMAGLVEKKELTPQEYAKLVLEGKVNPLKV